MKLLKKLRNIFHYPAVTVKELRDTGAVQARNPVRYGRETSLIKEVKRPESNLSGKEVLARKQSEIRCIRPARKSSLQDIPLSKITAIKHMKHGRQAQWYRKSVRANITPEEIESEEEN